MNGVSWFASVQHKFNVHIPVIPRGYTLQSMCVIEDLDRVMCVSSYYFVTIPNADVFVDFCVHTATKSTTRLIRPICFDHKPR